MRVRVRAYLATFVFWLAYSWAARVLFLAYHWARAAELPLGELAGTFRAGFRLDVSGAAYLTALPALLLILSVLPWFQRIAVIGIGAWTSVVAVAGAFLIATDLEIYRRWDRRIDAAIVPYLATPKEAWASAGASPRLLLVLLALAFGAGAAWLYRRVVMRDLERLERAHPLWVVPSVLMIGLLVAPARGGFQEIPLTQGSAYFSARLFANFAAQNALWTFVESVTLGQWDRVNHYTAMRADEADGLMGEARARAGPTRPIPVEPSRPNILLIIWESGSARAIGALGGVAGVTPAFDSLTRDGILFRQFYAAGDQTQKGVAALLSGFPGLPRGSMLKTPRKAAALPAVGRDFHRNGYRTAFYYGGELEFAGLRPYLLGAGFDQVVGKDDFPKASWNSLWGAHDLVVADRVLADLATSREPFFSVWLTLSSHEPFETPEPVTIRGTDWQSQYFNSLAYTDRVIGRLIAAARRAPWWKNTLVVIVADHGRRVVPLDERAPFKDARALFRIPMLWLGGAVTARDSVVDEIGSQVDLAPTLLEVAGITPAAPYRWARSLFEPVAKPFAYYGFQAGFGLVTPGGNLVYDAHAGQFVTRTGSATAADERLGRALMQLTYQEYLDR